MNVKDCMNSHVIAVAPEENVAVAARLMARHNVGVLPVRAVDGSLCGIVTDRDMILRCVALNRDPEKTAVSRVMTSRVKSVAPDTSLTQAAALMALTVLCAPVLMMTSGMLRTAVLLGLICAGMYGANTMLTALIPLEYNCVGKTGMTAGLIDSFIYAGSAFSGVVGGGIYGSLGRNTLYGTWAAAGMVSVVLLAAAGRMSARYWKAHRGQEE